MTINILKYSLVSLFAISAFSCSNNDDEIDQTKPTITINSPKNEEHLHVGETIEVDALISDDRAVSSYKIDIHYAGDGHTHEHRAAAEPWSYKFDEEISGNVSQFAIKRSISIPHNIQDGHYHFGIIAIDKSGNERQSYIEIEIADHGHDHDHE